MVTHCPASTHTGPVIFGRGAGICRTLAAMVLINAPMWAQEEIAPPPPLPPEIPQELVHPPKTTLYIRAYRIQGTKVLPRADVDEAVYPYLGPDRSVEDVEAARAALEQAYHEKGFQTVTVSVPRQNPARGIIYLQVTETPVGRLRVKGAKYNDIEKIKKRAPSLAEGTVPDFNEVQREIIALNQSGDMQVTPTMKPGVIPGTVDVDLEVKDSLPFHGSVELNNRYSANTTPLRLNVDARYSNLWQLGHTIGMGFQIAPQRPQDAIVYSGYYIAPVPMVDWLSLMVQAIRQNSNVSTLGGSAVAGNGEIYGGRLLFELPSGKGFFQSASFGLDYKHFTQDLTIGDEMVGSPVTYWPFTLSYNATLLGKGRETELSAAVVFHFRGMGSAEVEFDNRRYNADGNFFYLRGSLGHTQDIPFGFQVFAQIQGQGSGVPLLDSEQFSLGGLNTVRGYLESAVLGDSAIAGTLELRTPSLLKWLGEGNEARLFVFVDGGSAYINDPLPEQTSQFDLWSMGFGATMQLVEHLHGELVFGVPMITQGPSVAYEPLVTFRVWGDL